MTRPSFSAYLSSSSRRLSGSAAFALAAVAFVFAFGVSPRAGAQTHGMGAQAHNAACSAHAKHGSHTCTAAKGHRRKPKTGARHRHVTGARHASQDKVQIPGPVSGGSAGMSCPDGVNATLDEEGTFACANGAEPSCEEGLDPVVSGDGSTLVCEPEPSEAGGEGEG